MPLISRTAIRRLFAMLAVFTTAAAADAQTYTWTGGTSGAWSNQNNWTPATVPGIGATAIFSGAGNNNTAITVGGIQPINTILFDSSAAAAYTFSANAGEAFLFDAGGAITVNSSVTTAQTFSTPLQLLGAFTVTNNGTNTLALNGNTTLATGGMAGIYTVAGSGATTIGGAIAATAITSLTKNDTGTLTLSATNLYTGGTTVNGGTILFTAAGGLGTGALLSPPVRQ